MTDTLEKVFIDIAGGVLPRLISIEDANLKYLQSQINSSLSVRGDRIIIVGSDDEPTKVKRAIQDLEAMYMKRMQVRIGDVDTVLRLAGILKQNGTSTEKSNPVSIDTPCGIIKTRGANQESYFRCMERSAIVFAIGPAGTGKTYLAVAKAIEYFQRKLVDKIILTRPVVESGETLGYLPGDILEKVDPYFRPLYDALDEMLTHERVRRFIERGLIEIAPLAYMRGRTLNRAFVILDEAQNTSSGQMKMFLTRLGVTSRTVLTGDLTQIDLSHPNESGLIEARDILTKVEGIDFVHFTEKDVVRHKLVADILRAYNGDKPQ